MGKISGSLKKKVKGGVARVVKAKARQRGQSNLKHDRRVRALAPGKRKSRSGRTYYEYRANRTDVGSSEVPKKRKKTKTRTRTKKSKKRKKRGRKGRKR